MISKNKDIRLILDNIRSVHNAGSIFRTAETLGITHIYCIGTTPTPTDRFGQKRKDFAKVALGSEEIIMAEYAESAVDIVKELKKKKFKIIALEQSTQSLDYKKVEATNKMVIILGNELHGVSQELITLSDIIAEIPLQGKKESLNVSVATGIFLYRLLDFS